MVKGIKVLLSLFLSLLVSSCILYEEEVSFNEDFSGKAKLSLKVPSVIATEIDKEFYEIKDQISRGELKEKEGIKLLAAKRVQEGNVVTYLFEISFKNPQAFSSFLSSEKSKEEIKIREEGSRLYWSRTIKRSPGMEEDEEVIAYVLSDYVWTYRVIFPYRVLDANGKVQEDKKTVVWKYDLYTILSSPQIEMAATLKRPTLIDRILKFFGLEDNERVRNFLKKLGLE
ncbi:MAG: hypothetical protein GXN96_01105 [Aquificae bacterium]|nr:hypothetical protein [Aquificota bacterium]